MKVIFETRCGCCREAYVGLAGDVPESGVSVCHVVLDPNLPGDLRTFRFGGDYRDGLPVYREERMFRRPGVAEKVQKSDNDGLKSEHVLLRTLCGCERPVLVAPGAVAYRAGVWEPMRDLKWGVPPRGRVRVFEYQGDKRDVGGSMVRVFAEVYGEG